MLLSSEVTLHEDGLCVFDPPREGTGADPRIRNLAGKTAGDRALAGLFDRLSTTLFYAEAGYDMHTGEPSAAPAESPAMCSCMPRNAARTVVCLEKWIVVALMLLLMGGAMYVMIYSLDLRSDCN